MPPFDHHADDAALIDILRQAGAIGDSTTLSEAADRCLHAVGSLADVVGAQVVTTDGDVISATGCAAGHRDTIPVMVGASAAAFLELVWEERHVETDDDQRAIAEMLTSQLARVVERERAQRAEDVGNALLRGLAQQSSDMLTLLDENGHVLFSSPAAMALVGYDIADVLDADGFSFIHPEDRPAVSALFLDLLADGGSIGPIELRVRNPAGGWFTFEATGRNIVDDPLIEGAIVINTRDVTDRVESDERLAFERTHDRLTGLATPDAFTEAVSSMLRDGSHGLAVAIIEIDRFRSVNEQIGRAGGDDALRQIARRLRLAEALDADGVSATVARLGGCRFGVVVRESGVNDLAPTLAARLLATMARTVRAGSTTMALTSSVGVALPRPGSDASDLLLDAEAGLRQARAEGGDRSVIVGELRDLTDRRAALEERSLRRGIDGDELRLWYQPVVDLATGGIVAMEALVRWEHPDRGLLGPDEFIPLAERTGLIDDLGAWTLRHACRFAADIASRGPSALRVAVNVSPRQFHHGLLDVVENALRDGGLAPDLLCLEVTEGMVMDDVTGAAAILLELKALGVRVSIDDFGTGHSSLAYLRRLPIDELKVDKSFVDGLPGESADSAIVATVIALAQSLGLEVVAEGVELPGQADALRRLGCELAQGYHFARPLPPADLVALLDAGQPLGTASTAVAAHTLAVVIADDSPEVLRLARMSLVGSGFEVHVADDGQSCLDAALDVGADCVVLDVGMPDMDGYEVCRRLRADPRTAACRIVMLTARGDARAKVQAYEAGADDFLVKPVTPRELVRRVRATLGARGTIGAT